MPFREITPGEALDRPQAGTGPSGTGHFHELPPRATLDQPGQATLNEKVYYNEAGQPFTLSGRPVLEPPDQGVTGAILPIHTDPSGEHHLAVPEMIAAPIRGLFKGGQRLLGVGEEGRDPLRPLDPDIMSTLAATVGTPYARAPAGALGPSTLVPGGRLATAGTPGLLPPKPSGINPERIALAQKAMDRGIPLTAGRINESGMTKVAESQGGKLPFSGAAAHEDEIQRAWNRNVAQTFGENTDRITRDVMSKAKTRIGGEINRIENSHNVAYSDAVVQKLADIETRAHSSLTAEEYTPVRRLLEGTIRNLMPGGKVAGTTYGALFRKDSPLDAAAGSKNANISKYASEIMNALRDGLQESLAPEEAAAYRAARFQYKNMMTVRPLVTKAVGGDISPALLRGRVDAQFPNAAFETGDNPLDELAQIGQAFLKGPPSSFTTERSVVQRAVEGTGRHIGTALTGGAGAAAATAVHPGILPAAIGAGATLAVNRGLQSYLRSPARAGRALARGERRVERATEPRIPVKTSGPLTRIGKYAVTGDISPYVRDDTLPGQKKQ